MGAGRRANRSPVLGQGSVASSTTSSEASSPAPHAEAHPGEVELRPCYDVTGALPPGLASAAQASRMEPSPTATSRTFEVDRASMGESQSLPCDHAGEGDEDPVCGANEIRRTSAVGEAFSSRLQRMQTRLDLSLQDAAGDSGEVFQDSIRGSDEIGTAQRRPELPSQEENSRDSTGVRMSSKAFHGRDALEKSGRTQNTRSSCFDWSSSGSEVQLQKKPRPPMSTSSAARGPSRLGPKTLAKSSSMSDAPIDREVRAAQQARPRAMSGASAMSSTSADGSICGATLAASSGSQASQPIRVNEPETLAAIASLYRDELKPYGRILRKRLVEDLEASGIPSPDVDASHLRTICLASGKLRVEFAEGGEWTALLVGCPEVFVDIYSPCDVYTDKFWNAAIAYFQCSDMAVQGGRYSFARALLGAHLPFLAGLSLGRICHITQLALQRKILGYSLGAIVPFRHSDGRSTLAQRSRHCVARAGTDPSFGLPVATQEMARAILRRILDSALRSGTEYLPLSNIKRIFHSVYHVELSETALGYDKLSLLLQAGFADLCSVGLRGSCYVVFPVATTYGKERGSSSSVISNVQAAPWPCSADVSELPVKEASAALTVAEQPSERIKFCPDEPLCLEMAGSAEPSADFATTTPSPLWPCSAHTSTDCGVSASSAPFSGFLLLDGAGTTWQAVPTFWPGRPVAAPQVLRLSNFL
mmetsp:Transcript_37582/g.82465  ORF Transcript_37582/g.82465 Transcript_37582/m.82465 type:complete len:704 (-) Transcript_37582:83-2194(-)